MYVCRSSKIFEQQKQGVEFMEGYNQWIKSGFDDGIFILVGSLQPNLGGSVIAHNTSLSELHDRVNKDPFAVENVVSTEILEIVTKKKLKTGLIF